MNIKQDLRFITIFYNINGLSDHFKKYKYFSANPEAVGCVERFATFLSFLLVIITFPFSLFECFKVIYIIMQFLFYLQVA